jgi:hypothetical protein
VGNVTRSDPTKMNSHADSAAGATSVRVGFLC